MRFRFLNIPVYIHPTFWLFLLFFTGLLTHPSVYGLIAGAILFVSLLIHEAGHVLTARYFGASVQIIFEAFGGRAEYQSRSISPKQSFLITLAGPLLESLLIPFAYFLLKSNVFVSYPLIQFTLYMTVKLNILFCLLNLIPVLPLDGGRLCLYLLERAFGPKGHRMAIALGVVTAFLGAAALYFVFSFPFFAVLLVIFGFQNLQMLRLSPVPKASSKAKSPFSSYMKAQELVNEGKIKEAKEILQKLLKSKDEKLKLMALEALAKLYANQKEQDASYALLSKADPKGLKEGKVLLCKLAFAKGNYALVAKHAQEIYQIKPSYEVAVLNAKAFAHLGHEKGANGWLVTASGFGPKEKEKVDELLASEVIFAKAKSSLDS